MCMTPLIGERYYKTREIDDALLRNEHVFRIEQCRAHEQDNSVEAYYI